MCSLQFTNVKPQQRGGVADEKHSNDEGKVVNDYYFMGGS